MKSRLYSYGGSNSGVVASRAVGMRVQRGGRSGRRENDGGKAAEMRGPSGVMRFEDGSRTSSTVSSGGGSFVARRPSPSGKPAKGTSKYSRRGGRRLRGQGSGDPAPLGLDVPLGMADSNPDAALASYQNQMRLDSSKRRDEEDRGNKQEDDWRGQQQQQQQQQQQTLHGGGSAAAQMSSVFGLVGGSTRGDLLRQAQQFKTFMEIMEESPLYELPYGDSFLYLQSVSGSTYDLKIVHHEDIDPNDYYTLSYAGVTHFVDMDDGTSGSEFTQLDQFEREHYLFSQISKLRFFQQFWMAKLFRMWRSNIRAAKMTGAQDRLRENLFILHPVLCEPLMELHTLASQAEMYRLYEVQIGGNTGNDDSDAQNKDDQDSADKDSSADTAAESKNNGGRVNGEPYTLDQFCDRQHAKSQRTRAQLDAVFEKQSAITFAACEATLNRFLIDNNFHTSSDLQRRGGAVDYVLDGSAAPADPLAQRKRSGSDVSNGSDSSSNVITVSFTERAAMRTQCKKLAKFIRLIDFFTVHTYLKVARSSIEYLMDRIRAVNSLSGKLAAANNNFDGDSDSEFGSATPSESGDAAAAAAAATAPTSPRNSPAIKAPLFVVEMDFEVKSKQSGKSRLRFMPLAEDFQSRVDRAVVDNLSMLSVKTPRLLTSRRFALFVQPTIDESGMFGEGADIESILLDDEVFSSMLDAIANRMRIAFNCAIEYAASFQQFLDVYVANLDVEAGLTYEAYEKTHYDTFREMIVRHQSQCSLFQKIPTRCDVSFITVDSSMLRKIFLPSPNRCLFKLAQLLPRIASSCNKAVNTEVVAAHDIVAHDPFNVAEFYRLSKFLEDFEGPKMDAMQQRYFFACEIFRLLRDFNIRTNEDQQQESFMLLQSWQALVDGLERCEDLNKSRKSQFIKELAKLVPKLHENTGKVRIQLEDDRIRSDSASAGEVLEYLDICTSALKKETDTAARYNEYQRLMGIPVLPWDDLEALQVDLDLKTKLWLTVQQWQRSSSTWLAAAYDAIDADEVSKQMQTFRKTVQQCEYGLADPTNERPNLAIPKLRTAVMEFASTLPVVADLRCPSLRKRHWDQIHDLLQFELHVVAADGAEDGADEKKNAADGGDADKKDTAKDKEGDDDNGNEKAKAGPTPPTPEKLEMGSSFTLGQLMERDIKAHAVAINTIATTAKAESGLEVMLEKLVKTWKKLEFEILPYKQRKNMFVVGLLDDIITVLDDSMVTVSTLLGSRYVHPIRDRVEDWQAKLTKFTECIEAWQLLQRTWAYLENIFNGPDIAKQLPSEDRLFKIVDKWYFEFMLSVARLPNCMECGTRHGVRDKMVEHVNTLDRVQKALEEFLETKRVKFPRFYFLSNDELLEILGQSKNARAVQPHMRKCFDAIAGLEFGDQASGAIDIFAMISPQGEVVSLGKNLKARGAVEEWLLEVESAMRKSLHGLFKNGLVLYEEMERPDWIKQSKGQVVAVISQVMWCRGTASALRSKTGDGSGAGSPKALHAWYQTNLDQLSQLTAAVRGKLTKIQRKVIVALCTEMCTRAILCGSS